jgi:hypothetical protein
MRPGRLKNWSLQGNGKPQSQSETIRSIDILIAELEKRRAADHPEGGAELSSIFSGPELSPIMRSMLQRSYTPNKIAMLRLQPDKALL